MIVAKAIVLIALVLIMLAVAGVFLYYYMKLLRWAFRGVWRLAWRFAGWYLRHLPPPVAYLVTYTINGWRMFLGMPPIPGWPDRREPR